MDSIDRLKLIRKKLKLTQEKLAISMGLKRDNITSIESRKVKISTLHALAIEYVHGINKDWLLFGDGDPFLVQKENSEPVKQTSEHKIIVQHQDLVTRFKDQEKGLVNNECLIDIEAISPGNYKIVSDLIQHTHQSVKTMEQERGEEDALKKKPETKPHTNQMPELPIKKRSNEK